MNKSIIYIVGATVLVGGAFLFLKNKKKKDADKLAELGGATTGGTTSSGATTTGATTTGGTTSGGITPSITEPVKIDKDLNLDAFNLQKILKELEDLEKRRKSPPKKENASGVTTKEWWNWYFSVGRQAEYDKARKPILEKLAKLGYKYENGLLVKI